jgi:hypothetical protein
VKTQCLELGNLLGRARAAGGIALVLAMSWGAASASTRLVPGEYPTIQAAVDAAAAGDTVLVAPGTYRGAGNRDIELRGKAVVVKSSEGSAQTIIDCERAGRGFYVHEWEPATTRIEGFTIRNGYVTGSSPELGRGGGIYCGLASIAIVNCRFEDCEASGDGGGLYLIVFDGIVDQCVFFGNYAEAGGGFFYYPYVSASITNCVIEENIAFRGGGVCIGGGTETRLYGCTIAGNGCYGGGGGGISAEGRLRLERCIVWGNCSIVEGDEIRCGYADFLCCDIDRSGVYSVEVNYDQNCIDTDPMFCVDQPCGQWVAGDWTLNESSPCLPSNSPCGQLIGALGAGCGGPTPVEVTSWGRLKARFR